MFLCGSCVCLPLSRDYAIIDKLALIDLKASSLVELVFLGGKGSGWDRQENESWCLAGSS